MRKTRLWKYEQEISRKSGKNTEDLIDKMMKKAARKFEILEKFECGIALKGTEVKSLRAGSASLDEAYAMLDVDRNASEAEVKKALTQFIYRPRFANGVAVATPDQQVRYAFPVPPSPGGESP